MKWRVINTDTEGPTGFAPVCEDPGHEGAAVVCGLEPGEEGALGTGPLVLDCCPHPHVETWSEEAAMAMAISLTVHEAELCS